MPLSVCSGCRHLVVPAACDHILEHFGRVVGVNPVTEGVTLSSNQLHKLTAGDTATYLSYVYDLSAHVQKGPLRP